MASLADCLTKAVKCTASSLRISAHYRADAGDGFELNVKRVARIRREKGIKVSKKQWPMKPLGISTAQNHFHRRQRW